MFPVLIETAASFELDVAEQYDLTPTQVARSKLPVAVRTRSTPSTRSTRSTPSTPSTRYGRESARLVPPLQLPALRTAAAAIRRHFGCSPSV